MGAALALCLGIGVQAGIAEASSGAPLASRPARMAPVIPAGSRLIGAVAPTMPVDLAVALAPRDEAALSAFIDATSDPSSPQFRRSLQPGQFAPRFGPAAATLAAVSASLRSLGLGATSVSADHLFVTARTTAAKVEAAFKVDLDRYELADGSIGYSATSAPLLGGVLASSQVLGILGLDSLVRPRSLRLRGPQTSIAARVARAVAPKTIGPQACADAVSTADANDSYTDTQIASAYQLSDLFQHGATGQHQVVAIAEFEPFSTSDVSTFQTCYGTDVSVTAIPEFGGPGTGAGSGEAAMDIENVIALAPGAAIDVYEAPEEVTDAEVAQLYDDMVSPDTAKTLSTSWGECELDEDTSLITAEETVFQEAAADGESLFAAAGDDGSEDCLEDGTSNEDALAVDDPGSDPYVISVGGTRLESLTPSESVWNDAGDGDGSGGGGISAEWPMESWQTGTGVINSYSSGTPCGASAGVDCREVPDVSADADPDVGGWVIYFEGAWNGGNGGTSASAPMWAAMLADINSYCTSGPVGFVAPALYVAAATPGNFTDVTSGNNDYVGDHGGDYPATTGFDLASGLGTPLAGTLADTLCGMAPPPLPTVGAISPASGKAAGGTAVTITGSDLSGATVVDFGTWSAKIDEVVSSTELKVTSPKGAGTVAVTVTTGDGTSTDVKADLFTFIAVPKVTKVSPSHGAAAGGTKVTITGSALSGATAVHFGSKLAKIIKVVSSTEVEVTAPKGAGTVNVTVTTPGGTSATGAADHYRY